MPLRLELPLDESDRDYFRRAVIEPAPVPERPQSPAQEAIVDFEFIRAGLQDYF